MIGFLLLRIAHIVMSGLWVGGAVFVAFFLMPALRAVGPTAGAVMQQLTQVRRLPTYMGVLTWGTLFSGGWLIWHDAGPIGFAWFHHGAGRIFGAGALVAIVAAVVGMTVSAPTAGRLGQLAARLQHSGHPPTPEDQVQMRALQARLTKGGTVVAILVLLAAALMASARYVG